MEEEKKPSSSGRGGGGGEAALVIKMVRGAITGVLAVVCVGYLMLWVMMPTSPYRNKWISKIISDTNSTYLGSDGSLILVFTFPVLFVAVLGSVYLHLDKKLLDNYKKVHSSGNKEEEEKKKKESVVESWKKPVIIRGLGIVCWVDLTIFAMFIGLLVWGFTNFLHYFFTDISKSTMETGDKEWQAKLERVGLTLGIAGNVCLTFLFFPVTRGSSVLRLFGLTSEASIKYHIWIGHVLMAIFTAHGVVYIVYWALTNRLSEMLKWSKTGVSNVAGELSLLSGLILWATTFPRVRRKTFELFFYTHYLYIAFIVFFVFHLSFGYSCIMLPGFYLFLVDRYLRFLQSRQSVRLLSARVLPCHTVELNFSKTQGLNYTPTSIMFINVPSISRLQWHPFTINSSSKLEPHTVSVLIKSEGTWTKKLYQILSAPTSVDRLKVSVEGPYGPASTRFLRHDVLVMISGGSGIAPFISIIRELMFLSSLPEFNTPKLVLISAFKYSSELTMLDLLLPISSTTTSTTSMELQIEAFVTREEGPSQSPLPENSLKLLRTVWFKPNPRDAPISPVLGRNSWLWLAAIVSSSFVAFLLSIGLLTQYYIYPIDHNTDEIYPHSAAAVLSMLLICLSIAIAGGVAFLWNKKQNTVEMKRMTVVEDKEGTMERELESLPHSRLIKLTSVHYGRRPDLKSILTSCEGSSVGVLVCGPKAMRHDVASICSSGLAKNLHFESISFTW